MKTLYLSDLDGTLLNKDSVLSPFTKKALNACLAKGMQFGIATARTAATVLQLFKDVSFNGPAILMTGTCIYNAASRRYERVLFFEPDAFTAAAAAFRTFNVHPFFYTIENNAHIVSVFEQLDNDAAKAFYTERKTKFGKDYRVCRGGISPDFAAVQITALDTYNRLAPVYGAVCQIPALRAEFYRDVYDPLLWYLEVLSCKASKSTAVQYLRGTWGCQRVVAFGDNKNDLPLFAAADEAYAVENAVEALKQKADGVIGKNTDDAVARYLLAAMGIDEGEIENS